MGAFSTNALYRGALIWNRPGFMIGPGFTLWKRLHIYGPHIALESSREDSFQFKIGARYYDDGKPMFSLGKGQETYRQGRADSLEAYIAGMYSFGKRKNFGVGVHFAKEVLEYKGLYARLMLKAPILPFTGLHWHLAVAEQSHNHYLYGHGAVSGLAHMDVKLITVIPFVPWDGMIMSSLNYSRVVQDHNRQASLVYDRPDNFQYSIRAFWNVL